MYKRQPSSSIASAPTDPDAPASLPDPLTLNQDLYFEGLQITLKQATASPTVGEAGMVTVGIDVVIENIGLGGAQSSWGGTIEIDGIATQSWGGGSAPKPGEKTKATLTFDVELDGELDWDDVVLLWGPAGKNRPEIPFDTSIRPVTGAPQTTPIAASIVTTIYDGTSVEKVTLTGATVSPSDIATNHQAAEHKTFVRIDVTGSETTGSPGNDTRWSLRIPDGSVVPLFHAVNQEPNTSLDFPRPPSTIDQYLVFEVPEASGGRYALLRERAGTPGEAAFELPPPTSP